MARENRIWQLAHDSLDSGAKIAMCTLVASHGSTPREVGARMLVGERGILAGTVGGGCGEAETMVIARKLIAGACSNTMVDVDLAGDLNQTATQACGGSMDVFVHIVAPNDVDVIATLANAESHRKRTVVAMRLDASARLQLVKDDRSLPEEIVDLARSDGARLIVVNERPWFVQTIGTREQMIIVGSGHVAQPLCRIATLLGFHVTVIDDRAGYANAANFPDASTIVVGDHAATLSGQAIDEYTSIVIITRGHQYDEAALSVALRTPARYVGMIGSKRRAIETIRKLAPSFDGGILPDRIHSPIGLDIGAQTPEEIALAILAEVVALRRGGSGVPLKTLRGAPRP